MFLHQCDIEFFDTGTEILVICSGTCVFRNELYSVVITIEEYQRILNDENIQDVIPHVHPAEREFLITGISPLGYQDFSQILSRDSKKHIPQQELHERKTNWKEFHYALEQNKIEKLYHFTDKSNLDSIRNVNGLLSFRNCKNYNVSITRKGGDELSLKLDKMRGLDNYIRLSFCPDHPMLFVTLNEGRILNPVILEISTEVIYFNHTKFSNQNAVKSGVLIGENIVAFKNIHLDLFKQSYFSVEEELKPFYQAEVLVLESIPDKYILNINAIAT